METSGTQKYDPEPLAKGRRRGEMPATQRREAEDQRGAKGEGEDSGKGTMDDEEASDRDPAAKNR
jgi:hypothetical protein